MDRSEALQTCLPAARSWSIGYDLTDSSRLTRPAASETRETSSSKDLLDTFLLPRSRDEGYGQGDGDLHVVSAHDSAVPSSLPRVGWCDQIPAWLPLGPMSQERRGFLFLVIMMHAGVA